MKKYLKNLTKTSILHYIKLIVRSGFFIAAGILFLTGDIEEVTKQGVFPAIVWVWYLMEMIIRLCVPTGIESMGCEKVFKKNYRPAKVQREPKNQSAKTTFIVAMAWFALNAIFYTLYLTNVVDKYFLALVAMGYGVGDIVCILFFCPFQTWFMKNRCCTTCRIYNWDFAMLFTPFLLIPHVYTYTLLGLALIILARWEITYKLHPERFSERTNESLRCKNCTEKLCKHKVQLQHFIKTHKDSLFERLEPVVEKLEPTIKKIEDQADNIEEIITPIEEGVQEAYEKTRDLTVETYTKAKDITKETYTKAKDITTEAYSKAKELTTETYSKAKELTVETYNKVKGMTKELLGIEKDLEKEALPKEPTVESEPDFASECEPNTLPECESDSASDVTEETTV